MSAHGSNVRWYAACAAYFRMPPEMRQPVARQTLAHYRRIDRMPRAWGEGLDIRRAPLFVMRWVAWANDEEEGERRYRTAVTSWDGHGRWPRWDQLTCGVVKGDEARHAEATSARRGEGSSAGYNREVVSGMGCAVK